MKKQKSRSARWMEAVEECKTQFDAVTNAAEDLSTALRDLRSIQEEYEEWQGNLPESLQSSALGEKLEAVMDIDIESIADEPLDSWGQVEDAIGEAEGAELPVGFGRD